MKQNIPGILQRRKKGYFFNDHCKYTTKIHAIDKKNNKTPSPPPHTYFEHLQVIHCQPSVSSDCCAVVNIGCQTDINLSVHGLHCCYVWGLGLFVFLIQCIVAMPHSHLSCLNILSLFGVLGYSYSVGVNNASQFTKDSGNGFHGWIWSEELSGLRTSAVTVRQHTCHHSGERNPCSRDGGCYFRF